MSIQVLSNNPEADTQANKPAESEKPAAPGKGTESAPGGEEKPEQNESEASDSSEAEEESEAGSEGEATSPKDGEETEPKDAAAPDQKPKKKSGFQRRVDKLNARISDREREVEYWREQALKGANQPKPDQKADPANAVAAEGEPQPEQFEDHRSYVKALAKFEAKQLLAEERQSRAKTELQTEQQKQVQTYTEKAKAFAAKADDYEEVMADVADQRLSPAIQDIFLSSENGPELAYELAKDPEEFARMCSLPPGQAYREMGKFEAKLALKAPANQEQKPKTITKAPKPLNPVNAGGKGSATKSIYDPNLSQRDYEAIRAKQRAQRSQAG